MFPFYVLRVVGALSMLGGLVLAIFTISQANSRGPYLSFNATATDIIVAVAYFLSGVTVWALFEAIAIIGIKLTELTDERLELADEPDKRPTLIFDNDRRS